ncbi:hypothetical protein [Xanthomonas euvesicatoria]|uniref:hypothetical protein n=1 Tax=Xanthomonas euvesicatoria TaxID=456327 RepID=UPI003892767D
MTHRALKIRLVLPGLLTLCALHFFMTSLIVLAGSIFGAFDYPDAPLDRLGFVALKACEPWALKTFAAFVVASLFIGAKCGWKVGANESR